MKIGKNIGAAVVAVALFCVNASEAQAESGCWQASEVAAAKVRDLQTRMMVAGLKCRGYGPELLAAYNRFVVVHRASIQRHNGVLRARFIRMDGRSAGQRGYDRYATALANAYGATSADPAACGEMVGLAKRAATARAIDLVALAEDHGLEPEMKGGACPVRMASSK